MQMLTSIKTILIRELESTIEKVRKDELVCSEDEAMRLIASLAHEPMSKERVLVYLGWSRAKFDDYVHRGLMPKGRKRSGWKELCWYRDEINDCLMDIRQKYGTT